MEGTVPELRATNAETAEAAQSAARAAGLRYVSDRDPGIVRVKTKTGFRYLDAKTRKPVKDEATLTRIKQLAIPPAYENVWICDPITLCPSPQNPSQPTSLSAYPLAP